MLDRKRDEASKQKGRFEQAVNMYKDFMVAEVGLMLTSG